MEIVSACGARRHHRTYIVGQPEGALNSACSAVFQVISLHHVKRHIGWQPIVFPRLNYVIYPLRLPVEGTPVAALVCSQARIVLEGEEREIPQPAMRLEVVEETSQKGNS